MASVLDPVGDTDTGEVWSGLASRSVQLEREKDAGYSVFNERLVTVA